MKQKFFKQKPSGSEKKNEPKVIGEVLIEYFQSDKPLAVAYRDRLFKDIHPNTELDIDLKLMTRHPGRIRVGEYLSGVITRDAENLFSFVENASEGKKVVITRNPHVYVGKFVNVTRKDDGTLYPTLNRPRYSENFSFKDLCREAAAELIVIAGLVGEDTQASQCLSVSV